MSIASSRPGLEQGILGVFPPSAGIWLRGILCWCGGLQSVLTTCWDSHGFLRHSVPQSKERETKLYGHSYGCWNGVFRLQLVKPQGEVSAQMKYRSSSVQL